MKRELITKMGLNRFFKGIFQQRKDKKFPQKDNPETIHTGSTSRRELIKNLAVLPVLGVPLIALDNANAFYSTLNSDLKRERKWYT